MPVVSPTSIYQDFETGCRSSPFTGSSSGVLSGRYSTPTPEQRQTLEDIPASGGLTPEPRLYSETGEVLSPSDTATDLPRSPSQLCDNDLLLPQEKLSAITMTATEILQSQETRPATHQT